MTSFTHPSHPSCSHAVLLVPASMPVHSRESAGTGKLAVGCLSTVPGITRIAVVHMAMRSGPIITNLLMILLVCCTGHVGGLSDLLAAGSSPPSLGSSSVWSRNLDRLTIFTGVLWSSHRGPESVAQSLRVVARSCRVESDLRQGVVSGSGMSPAAGAACAARSHGRGETWRCGSRLYALSFWCQNNMRHGRFRNLCAVPDPLGCPMCGPSRLPGRSPTLRPASQLSLQAQPPAYVKDRRTRLRHVAAGHPWPHALEPQRHARLTRYKNASRQGQGPRRDRRVAGPQDIGGGLVSSFVAPQSALSGRSFAACPSAPRTWCPGGRQGARHGVQVLTERHPHIFPAKPFSDHVWRTAVSVIASGKCRPSPSPPGCASARSGL